MTGHCRGDGGTDCTAKLRENALPCPALPFPSCMQALCSAVAMWAFLFRSLLFFPFYFLTLPPLSVSCFIFIFSTYPLSLSLSGGHFLINSMIFYKGSACSQRDQNTKLRRNTLTFPAFCFFFFLFF